MLDLQALQAGIADVIRLQPGDQLAALVAERHYLVQFGRETAADEAAVARVHRQLVGERRVQPLDQRGVLAEVRGGFGEARGEGAERALFLGLCQPVAGLVRAAEPIADGGKIARSAAPERQPRQRACHVRAFGKRIAEVAPEPLVVDQPADGIEARGNGARVGKGFRETRGQQARARAGDGTVHDSQQASLHLAR